MRDNVVDMRPTWERRIEAERRERDEAEKRFEAAQAKRRKWRRVKFAARVAAAPVLVAYAVVRLGVELYKAR